MEFTPNDAWVFYGSATNGTKPGAFDSFTVADVNPGFPSPIAAPGTDVNSVDEEEVWSYEVGAKGSWLEGRASIALAAYHYAYQDLQQQVFRGVTFATANVGEAEGKGVEMELVLRANEFAQFRASGAWQDVEMKEIDLGSAWAVGTAPASWSAAVHPEGETNWYDDFIPGTESTFDERSREEDDLPASRSRPGR